jgi:hypothetical protein
LVAGGVHPARLADRRVLIRPADPRAAATRSACPGGGKDLQFLIALDGGGETQIQGRAAVARGATTAAYGITSFPTQILIDREGNVVGRFRKKDFDKLVDEMK